MDAVTHVPTPTNETVLDYAPGSPERASLEVALVELATTRHELPHTIGGTRVTGKGPRIEVRQPHAHRKVLGVTRGATTADAAAAVDAAMAAAPAWRDLSFDDRAAILLKAADLLAGPWRARINAATMLGQSKTAYQAEIDAACELIDFWRFNVHFARQILQEQPPANSRGLWNRSDYRSLEGFVYAVTPFNFTAIAGNLPTAPALMGNTVVWKPSHSQQLAAQLTMELLEEAGMPPGVINLVTGHGREVSDVALRHPEFAGLHFTGSTAVFQGLWRTIGENLTSYRHYPRIVGETGGKDFILAHPSADPDVLRTAMLRGAFEYQGQKCSAASRAYVPRSVWRVIKNDLADLTNGLAMGDVTDLSNFMGAVIDERAFAKHKAAIDRAHATSHLDVVAGGTYDDSVGYFVRPTVVESSDPTDEMFRTEYFGPILAVHVYPDRQYSKVLDQLESFAPYALTGAIIAQDRSVIADATQRLRFAAGNFYVNDKPTGAVVGPAAVRRRACLGHQRQGRIGSQPDAVDLGALDQGELRAPDQPRLPPHGLTAERECAGSAGEPLPEQLDLDPDRRVDRVGRGPLELAPDERHVGLQLGLDHLDGASPMGLEPDRALDRERGALDVDVDRRGARAVGCRADPVEHLDDGQVVTDERACHVGKAVGRQLPLGADPLPVGSSADVDGVDPVVRRGGALGLLEGPVGEQGVHLVHGAVQLLARRQSHPGVLSLVGPAILSSTAQAVRKIGQRTGRVVQHGEHPVAPAAVLREHEVELGLERLAGLVPLDVGVRVGGAADPPSRPRPSRRAPRGRPHEPAPRWSGRAPRGRRGRWRGPAAPGPGCRAARHRCRWRGPGPRRDGGWPPSVRPVHPSPSCSDAVRTPVARAASCSATARATAAQADSEAGSPGTRLTGPPRPRGTPAGRSVAPGPWAAVPGIPGHQAYRAMVGERAVASSPRARRVSATWSSQSSSTRCGRGSPVTTRQASTSSSAEVTVARRASSCSRAARARSGSGPRGTPPL